jgi:SARP family transcriptional regulator, regulator of embCAB operon
MATIGSSPGPDRGIGFGCGLRRAIPTADMSGVPEPAGARLGFGILGPLDVRFGGQPLELRRVKERTLLAVLAHVLRVKHVVSVDHLAAALWGDAEAPRPPATLRVHVSRLRQALAAVGVAAERVVVTSGLGYVLQVPA